MGDLPGDGGGRKEFRETGQWCNAAVWGKTKHGGEQANHTHKIQNKKGGLREGGGGKLLRKQEKVSEEKNLPDERGRKKKKNRST